MEDHDESGERSRKTPMEPVRPGSGKKKRGVGESASKGTDEFPPLEFAGTADIGGSLPEDADLTETIDLTSLFSKELSATGSFDIRGDIWKTTFGQVLQALPIPALLIDQDYKLFFANQACSKISSAYEKIRGVPFRTLFPNPAVSSKVQLLLEDVFSTRKTKVAQAVLQLQESRIWARITFRSVRIMRERHLLALIEDLSSEKKQIHLKEKFSRELEQRVEERTAALNEAKDALQKSEERFRALVESTSDWIWERNEKGVYTYASPRIRELLGYEPEDVAGKSPSDLMPEKDAVEFDSTFQAIARSGKPFRGMETINRRKDGRLVVIETSGVPFFDSEGKLLGYRGIDRDITQRKQAEEALRKSEEKYRTILETIADGYHETDLKGNLTLVNDSLCEILGYSREELLGMNYCQLMDEANVKRTYEAYTEAYRTGNANPGIDIEVLRKDGTKGQVSVSIALIRDSEQRINGFRGVFRDVTKHRQLEEQLQQAAKMEAVGRLAGGIAHDFNNLLTAVIGYTNLLMDQMPTDDVQGKRLAQIARAAERAAGLTKQLLAYGRKQVLETRVLDINEAISGMEEMLRRIIGEDIELITVHSSLPGLVRADPGQIEQVLMNLAVNARDVMPNGGELIIETANVLLDEDYCRTHPEVEPGSYIMFAVSDNGQGMEPETISKIFDPFFTTKEKGVGTGLGLATVYGIVKQHGGHVAVYSQVGRGTIFKVYLPCVEDFLVEVQQSMSSAPRPEGRETVLVVEDEEVVRNLTCEVLDILGYCTLPASDPEQAQAINRSYEGPIHLLLTDVVLPQMDGRRLYQTLSVTRPEMKVLYCSGYTENFIVHQGVLDQGVQFLAKPFTVDALARKVRETLDGAV
jgi:two-component system, cell cycle sensor histidine kinase and response regulator CckA